MFPLYCYYFKLKQQKEVYVLNNPGRSLQTPHSHSHNYYSTTHSFSLTTPIFSHQYLLTPHSLSHNYIYSNTYFLTHQVHFPTPQPPALPSPFNKKFETINLFTSYIPLIPQFFKKESRKCHG